MYRFGYILLEALVRPHRNPTDYTYEATFHDVTPLLPGPLPHGSWSSPSLCQLIHGCLNPTPDHRPIFPAMASSLAIIADQAATLGV